MAPPAPPLSIAYFSDRDTPGYGEIDLMNPDGSGQTRLSSILRVPESQPGSGPGVNRLWLVGRRPAGSCTMPYAKMCTS